MVVAGTGCSVFQGINQRFAITWSRVVLYCIWPLLVDWKSAKQQLYIEEHSSCKSLTSKAEIKSQQDWISVGAPGVHVGARHVTLRTPTASRACLAPDTSLKNSSPSKRSTTTRTCQPSSRRSCRLRRCAPTVSPRRLTTTSSSVIADGHRRRHRGWGCRVGASLPRRTRRTVEGRCVSAPAVAAGFTSRSRARWGRPARSASQRSLTGW